MVTDWLDQSSPASYFHEYRSNRLFFSCITYDDGNVPLMLTIEGTHRHIRGELDGECVPRRKRHVCRIEP